jgi:hypothetical protein
MHHTRIFLLLDDGTILPVAQHQYAKLVKGEAGMPELALRRARVADWYVAKAENGGFQVDNETYSTLYFDEAGKAQPLPDADLIRENKSLHVASAVDPYAERNDNARRAAPADSCWSPTPAERKALLAELSRI